MMLKKANRKDDEEVNPGRLNRYEEHPSEPGRMPERLSVVASQSSAGTFYPLLPLLDSSPDRKRGLQHNPTVRKQRLAYIMPNGHEGLDT